MSVFSERLTDARKAMGWTRKRAVAEFQIPYQTYSNYEQGKREPDIETMKRLAQKLNTTIDYLTGATDNLSDTNTQNDTALTWSDLDVPMPYGGKIPEDLKQTYADLAKSYFKRHPEMLNKE